MGKKYRQRRANRRKHAIGESARQENLQRAAEKERQILRSCEKVSLGREIQALKQHLRERGVAV